MNKSTKVRPSNQNKEPNVRRLALYALEKIETGGYSNIVIGDILNKNEMQPCDRALFSALVRGVTERKLTLDYFISALSSVPIEKLDTDALTLLRMGIYQISYMDSIPSHAAVNETVSLARTRSRGFINAVLRSYLRKKDTIAPPKDEMEALSFRASAPLPLCEKLCGIFGKDKAERILLSSLEARDTDISVNTLRTDRESLAERIREAGYCAEKGTLSPYCIKTDAPYSALDRKFSGEFFMQDEASQVCACALGMNAGESLIDTCSAPGGKSFLSAILMKNKGRIVSCDLHASKLSLIRSGAERLGISVIETKEADGKRFIPEYKEAFDAVLCDVPCSGYGVIGAKPEIKYKELSDAAALPDIQYAILENASRYVKKGGTLVYSTCTIFPEENEQNVGRFLEGHGDFSLEPFAVGGKTYDGMLTLTQDNGMTDGFYIAKMKRK